MLVENVTDYKSVVIDLIRTIRLPVKQTEFSRMLGFSYNVVSRWESGARSVHWCDLVHICEARSIDLRSIIELVIGINLPCYTDGSKLLEKIGAVAPVDSISGEVFSKNKYWRIVKGRTKLTAEDFVHIVDYIFDKKNNFLYELGLNQNTRNGVVENRKIYSGLQLDAENLLISQMKNLDGIRMEGNTDFIESREGRKPNLLRHLNALDGFNNPGLCHKAYKDDAKSLYQEILRQDSFRMAPGIGPEDLTELISFPSNDQLDEKVYLVIHKFLLELNNLVKHDISKKDRLGIVSLNLLNYNPNK